MGVFSYFWSWAEASFHASRLSPSSIVFWRHLVGLFLILSLTPPYSGGSLSEWLGASVGKFGFGVLLSGAVMLLALLFVTSVVREKFWLFFIAGAWIFSGLGIYFWYYSQR